MIKRILFVFLILSSMVWADMIEIADDDPYQDIVIECNPAEFDSIRFSFLIEGVSDWDHYYIAPVDTVHTLELNYISPDRDSNGNLIPGTYEGGFYYYLDYHLIGGGFVTDSDTTHIHVGPYTIPGGCGSTVIIDP